MAAADPHPPARTEVLRCALACHPPGRPARLRILPSETAHHRLPTVRHRDLVDMLPGHDGRPRPERTTRRPRTDAGGPTDIELLSGPAETRARVRDLIGAATRRCWRLWTANSPDDSHLAAPASRSRRPGNLVRHRTICTPDSLRPGGPPVTPERAGDQAGGLRILPELPMRLTLVDDTAVASLDGGDQALLIRAPALVDTLAQYFELLWRRAAPLDSDRPFGPGQPSPAQLQVLRLAAAGLKDEAVARALGRTSRWVRRQMELLEELTGATNRLTLGIAAAQRKWI